MGNKKPESHMGSMGWAGLIAGVVAYEILGAETLSSAYDRYLAHPVKRFLAIGAVAITGAHLLNMFEHFEIEDLDPIENLGRIYGRLHDTE